MRMIRKSLLRDVRKTLEIITCDLVNGTIRNSNIRVIDFPLIWFASGWIIWFTVVPGIRLSIVASAARSLRYLSRILLVILIILGLGIH